MGKQMKDKYMKQYSSEYMKYADQDSHAGKGKQNSAQSGDIQKDTKEKHMQHHKDSDQASHKGKAQSGDAQKDTTEKHTQRRKDSDQASRKGKADQGLAQLPRASKGVWN